MEFILIVFMGLIWVTYKIFIKPISKSVTAEFTHQHKIKEMPVYTTENIGRDYIAIGSVRTALYGYTKSAKAAEIELIEQAKKLGADAIVGVTSSDTSFSGTAVRFKNEYLEAQNSLPENLNKLS